MAFPVLRVDVHPLDAGVVAESCGHGPKVTIVIFDGQVYLGRHGGFAPSERVKGSLDGLHGEFHRRDRLDLRPRQYQRSHAFPLTKKLLGCGAIAAV